MCPRRFEIISVIIDQSIYRSPNGVSALDVEQMYDSIVIYTARPRGSSLYFDYEADCESRLDRQERSSRETSKVYGD